MEIMAFHPDKTDCPFLLPCEEEFVAEYLSPTFPGSIYFFVDVSMPDFHESPAIVETPDEIWVYIDHMDEVQPWASSEWECVAYAIDSWPNCVYFFADEDTKKAAEFWQ